MKIIPITRADYRKRQDDAFISEVMMQFQGYAYIPEGGTNKLAVRGVSEMLFGVLQQDNTWDYVITPVGSAGTLAGCVDAIARINSEGSKGQGLPEMKAIGVSALRGGEKDISTRLLQLLPEEQLNLCEVWHDYHFGGFGRIPAELVNFIDVFYQSTKIPLDPVYTAKMMFAVLSKIEEGSFLPGSKLLVLHTGGLQGARSIAK